MMSHTRLLLVVLLVFVTPFLIPVPGRTAPAAAPTVTTLASSQNPSAAGQAVTLTATVSTAPAGGTVAFRDNSVVSGALPAGLTLDAGGTVSGVPAQPGMFLFAVQAADANNVAGTRSYTLTVEVAPVLHAAPGGLTAGACDTWADACELHYALGSSVPGSGQEIWVAAGTYRPAADTDRTATFRLVDGVAVYGGFDTTETERDQRDPAEHVVTLSGDLLGNDGAGGDNNGDNSYHVVTGADGATLDGVTIRGGNANGASYPDWCGGGMINSASSPTLTHVIFVGNTASNVGGGMLNTDGSAPHLTDMAFVGNTAETLGGAMFNSFDASPVLLNVTFWGNSAGWYGGAIASEGGYPVLTHVTFGGNPGGAIYVSSGTTQVINSILWGDGEGEVYKGDGGSATFDTSIVQGGCPEGSTCTGVLASDPLLGVPGDHGGGLLTIPILPRSPAIDVTNAHCPATDARGVARPLGAACDLGAYEAQIYGIYLPLVVRDSGPASPLR